MTGVDADHDWPASRRRCPEAGVGLLGLIRETQLAQAGELIVIKGQLTDSVVNALLGATTIAAGLVLNAAPRLSDLIAAIPLDVLFGVAAVEAYVLSVHRPLQPWCPQCHWDDGDDKEDVPDPVPRRASCRPPKTPWTRAAWTRPPPVRPCQP